ncbi:MAG: ribbon-helix-helix protein, CopG family [Dehalococcoidia bacterium]|nr:ribbon-helix-helix protein, CopG family [Dehalococcoidia bacterium]MYK26065.1 ribbon-helix-helix protein, CopG family [Dehalococcoidia bacterium]
MSARLEVRLDDERKQRLEQLGEAEGVPISEVVRRLIDDAWEEVMRARRIAAVERMAQLEVEDPPDPETLSRELEETYGPGGLS